GSPAPGGGGRGAVRGPGGASHLAGGGVRGPRVDGGPGQGSPGCRPRFSGTRPAVPRAPPGPGRPGRVRGGAGSMTLVADGPHAERPGTAMAGGVTVNR